MGIWNAGNTRIIEHKRLSVIDLSEYGKQPMQSLDERYIISHDGEIYNFQVIMNDLCQSWILEDCQHSIKCINLIMYHLDDILIKVDRPFRAFSLETGLPCWMFMWLNLYGYKMI